MLHVEDLNFSYGSDSVLKDISFDAEENNIISILGPNGVGKTTLLKCLCNVHKPQTGEILINGVDILKLSGREMSKNIGYVPQFVPKSRMTVYDSVLLGRKPYFELNATREDLRKVSEVISGMGLAPLSLKYITNISGGEFQKVHIARAIVQEPKVLILDEPTNNLDIANQHKTMQMIEKVVRSRGICTLMTMHDINLAAHYSDKFMFINEGRILAYGGPEVITEELIRKVYDIDVEIIDHRGVPMIIPQNSSKYVYPVPLGCEF